jgi:hypothetical protein
MFELFVVRITCNIIEKWGLNLFSELLRILSTIFLKYRQNGEKCRGKKPGLQWALLRRNVTANAAMHAQHFLLTELYG